MKYWKKFQKISICYQKYILTYALILYKNSIFNTKQFPATFFIGSRIYLHCLSWKAQYTVNFFLFFCSKLSSHLLSNLIPALYLTQELMAVTVFVPFRWDFRNFFNSSDIFWSKWFLNHIMLDFLTLIHKYFHQFSWSTSWMVSIDGNSVRVGELSSFHDNKTTFLNAKFYSYVLTEDSNRINKGI